ncbi:MAG: phosphoribosyl-ATP diphosphatase [Magnetococcales bacterium]|nr:phosphoribosyl-ATP diphosphatase [Magnetococcales bacterium]
MTTDPNAADILQRLYPLLVARKQADPATSYVAALHAKGLDKILEKVGEEAVETLLAAKNRLPAAIIHETADLWFHTLVMLAHLEIPVEQVLEELANRFGTSGQASKSCPPFPSRSTTTR